MNGFHEFIVCSLKCIRSNRHHRDQAMEADCVWVGQPVRLTFLARPRASQTQPPYSVQALEVPAAYNGRVYMSHSGDQARVADLAATFTTIGLSHRAAIDDKVSSVVGTV